MDENNASNPPTDAGEKRESLFRRNDVLVYVLLTMLNICCLCGIFSVVAGLLIYNETKVTVPVRHSDTPAPIPPTTTPQLPLTMTFTPQIPATILPSATPLKITPSVVPSLLPSFTQPPPTATPGTPIEIISLTDSISQGAAASLTIRTLPGASCALTYITPAGNPSNEAGLESITADQQGICYWTWLIKEDTPIGGASLIVSANENTMEIPINITEP
jgi:hypothetical protein